MFSNNRLKKLHFCTNKASFHEEYDHFLKVLLHISVCFETVLFIASLYGSFSKCDLVCASVVMRSGLCVGVCVWETAWLSAGQDRGGWRKGMLLLHVACNLLSSNQSKNNNTEELRQMCVCESVLREVLGEKWNREGGGKKRRGMKTWRN